MVRARFMTPLLLAGALLGCGGDDDAGIDDTAPADAESGVPPTPPPADDQSASATTAVDGGVAVDEVPADPAELADPTGTILVAGTTHEVKGYAQAIEGGEFVALDGDFLICEADNPAFPGDANIIVDLGDGVEFGFGISDDEAEATLGDVMLREETTEVTYERVDRTITGTAEFAEAGTIEFDITCG